MNTEARSIPARSILAAICGASLALSLFVPALTRSPFGDLGSYTDHLRHTFSSWIFLHRGFELYRTPYGQIGPKVPYKHPTRDWPDVPYIYPPGTLILFLPPAALGQLVSMPETTFNRWVAAYVLIIAHLAVWATLLALLVLPAGLRAAVGVLCWLILIRAGLNGMYDPAWIGCGAMMLRSLALRRWAHGLGWFACAALLHYRAVVLVPFAAIALRELLRGRSIQQRPWRALLPIGLGCLISLACFVSSSRWGDTFRDVPSLLSTPSDPLLAVAVSATLVGVAMAVYAKDVWLGAAVLITGVLALIDSRHWWHGTVVIVPLLALGAVKPSPRLFALRAGFIAWALVMQRVWNAMPLALFRQLRIFMD